MVLKRWSADADGRFRFAYLPNGTLNFPLLLTRHNPL